MKNIIITEAQWRSLIGEDDEMNQQIINLIQSGQPDNILLAVQLAKGQGLDVSQYLQPYVDFSDSVGGLAPKTTDPIEKITQLFALTNIGLAGQSNPNMDVLTSLRNLRTLTLKKFKGYPTEINKMNWLVGLDLQQCNITAADVENNIENFPHLQSLNLSDNKIHQFPKNITKLDSLKVLILDYNWLKGLPKELITMPNLNTLFLQNTQMDENDLNILRQMKHLTSLRMGMNNFGFEDIKPYLPNTILF